jgi:TonB family protein
MKRIGILSILTSIGIHLGILALLLGWMGEEWNASSVASGGVVWYNLNPGGNVEASSSQGDFKPRNETHYKIPLYPPFPKGEKVMASKKLVPTSQSLTTAEIKTPSTGGNGSGEGKGDGVGTGEGIGGIGPIGAGGGDGRGDRVLFKIKRKIARAKRYPLQARRNQVEGSCGVSFEINPDGSSKNLELLQSSGHSILDEEALSTIQRASPFPYYPGPIKLSLKYSLR